VNSDYEVVFRQDPDGVWLAEVPALPGCHTYGETLDEARAHIRDAVALWLESDEFTLSELVVEPKAS